MLRPSDFRCAEAAGLGCGSGDIGRVGPDPRSDGILQEGRWERWVVSMMCVYDCNEMLFFWGPGVLERTSCLLEDIDLDEFFFAAVDQQGYAG